MIYHIDMPHVSGKKLKAETLGALEREFLDMFSVKREKADARAVVEEFFTDTERLMFGKRLATISMLADGYSFSEIRNAIGVTPQTVSRVYKMVTDGKYKRLAKAARELAHSGGFAEAIGLAKRP